MLHKRSENKPFLDEKLTSVINEFNNQYIDWYAFIR